MKILFCNIGWMSKYDGIAGDTLLNGGSYNESNTGHEVCNFTDNRGFYYAYARPVKGKHMKFNINIERIGKPEKKDCISGVTVVWTATRPKPQNGTVIVGWYHNATVYRDPQKIPSPTKKQQKYNINDFYILASADEAVLLPMDQRTFNIPRQKKGFMGQSHIWYADTEIAKDFVNRVKEYLVTVPTSEQTSQVVGLFPGLGSLDLDVTALEGNKVLSTHLIRERDKALVNTKKRQVLEKTGTLCCAACDFDFKKTYGDIGDGFCEVHHIKPLSTVDSKTKTSLTDLAILCSNCHRMIHKTKPLMSVTEFRQAFFSR